MFSQFSSVAFFLWLLWHFSRVALECITHITRHIPGYNRYNHDQPWGLNEVSGRHIIAQMTLNITQKRWKICETSRRSTGAAWHLARYWEWMIVHEGPESTSHMLCNSPFSAWTGWIKTRIGQNPSCPNMAKLLINFINLRLLSRNQFAWRSHG